MVLPNPPGSPPPPIVFHPFRFTLNTIFNLSHKVQLSYYQVDPQLERKFDSCGYNSTEQSKISDHKFKEPHSKPCIVHICGSKNCMATSVRLSRYI